jgi:hypothetical protein
MNVLPLLKSDLADFQKENLEFLVKNVTEIIYHRVINMAKTTIQKSYTYTLPKDKEHCNSLLETYEFFEDHMDKILSTLGTYFPDCTIKADKMSIVIDWS